MKFLRVIDFTLAFFALVFASPLMLLIFFIAFIETGMPIFQQDRLGMNEKIFKMFKFRTMHVETASLATHLTDSTSVTKFGKFLRFYKLDELPQLWNVIVGEMSLVGPRPGLQNQTELTKARQKLGIFKVKPGITGLAQIKKIDMSTPTKLAEIDLYMIKTMSLKNYFKYLFLTLKGSGQGDQVKITL